MQTEDNMEAAVGALLECPPRAETGYIRCHHEGCPNRRIRCNTCRDIMPQYKMTTHDCSTHEDVRREMLGHAHFQVDDIDPVDHEPSTKHVICWCVIKKSKRAVRFGTVDLDSDEENGSSSSEIK